MKLKARLHHQLLPSSSSSLITILLTFLLAQSSAADRRILHQPLYPEPDPSPSPPPPSDTTPYPNPDIPFYPEVPNPVPNPPPPVDGGVSSTSQPSSAGAGSAVPIPVATQTSSPTKKVAIAISVGIVSLGMLSALVFFLFRHGARQSNDTQKLVGGRNEPPSRSVPPSNFLYIGTVEPSSRRFVTEQEDAAAAEANQSPYHKLNSAEKFSNRYRPSPELQPLPPLVRPLSKRNSRSAVSASSEDKESFETSFYTPNRSSSEAPAYTGSNNNLSLLNPERNDHNMNSNAPPVSVVPRSRRTSPKARLHPASPPQPPPLPLVMIPSIKPMPETQPVEEKSHQRTRFAAPPPPPNMAFASTISHKKLSPSWKSNTAAPPPPPPPPPPLLSASNRYFQQTAAHISSAVNYPTQKPQEEHETPFSTSAVVSSDEQADRGSLLSLERQDSDDMEGGKTKLKPLHWDKVRAISHRQTVWDQLKSSSFKLNEDMMENLFGCSTTREAAGENTVVAAVKQEHRVLDPKKSQNIAILLRALNVTREEVVDALLNGSEDLGAELYETLMKMAPTREEEIKLQSYDGDISMLGSSERFLKAVLDVPFAFKRIEAMLFRANFDAEVNYLRKSFLTLETASEELKSSRLFLKLLEAVLMTGNRMNVGTNRGDAVAFKLDTLLKLVDIKGTDGKTTLLHFVVQEIVRSEDTSSDHHHLREGVLPILKEENFRKYVLQVVAGLSRDLKHVSSAAGMDSDVLRGYVSKLESGLDEVRNVFQYEKAGIIKGRFFNSFRPFLKNAEDEIFNIKADEKKALSVVKEVTEYFHGDTTREEAHPLRIFMIVRDFLLLLDHVCKEVGQMKNMTVVGGARSFRISSSASFPVLSKYNDKQDKSSDEE